jgi:hypothetical protein
MNQSQSLPSAPSLVAETQQSSPQAALAARRKAFGALHGRGCFVIPNRWDVGSARYLQHLGFQALATTSAGIGLGVGEIAALGVRRISIGGVDRLHARRTGVEVEGQLRRTGEPGAER